MIFSRTLRGLSTLAVILCAAVPAWAQLEHAVITHNSESITIAPIVYGIERGFYKREGLDLEFRLSAPILPRRPSPAARRSIT